MSTADSSFPGGVFHASIPGGRAGARLHVRPQEVAAETSGEELLEFSIPLRECHLDLGGASGRMVFCRNADRTLTLFSEAKGFAEALTAQGHGTLDAQLATLRSRERRRGNVFRMWTALSLAAVIVVAVVGYYGILATARAAVGALPISIDEKIGELASQSMNIGPPLARDHPATKLVEGIVARLEPHAALDGIDFRIRVVDDEQVNAFALPGGSIVVFTGLIKEATSCEQIAGVIAHEMSHATLRHGLQSVSQSLGIVAALQFLVGDVGGLLSLGAQVAQQSILTSYSRQSETEADLEGARMLHAAKIDPKAMADFFALLEKQGGEIPDALSWISTHPQHRDRIETILQYRRTLGTTDYQPLEFDLPAAQAALP